MSARQLSQFEQDTLVEALTQIDAASKAQKLAEHALAIEAERAGRVAAETKVGELTSELVKRGEAYRAAVSDLETKLLQARESRSTAEMLAAQAKTEADGERAKYAEIIGIVEQLREDMAAMMTVQHNQVAPYVEHMPASYRINIVNRDAAGDLRSLELVPIEKE